MLDSILLRRQRYYQLAAYSLVTGCTVEHISFKKWAVWEGRETVYMTSVWTPGFNPDDLADQLYKHFGPGTEYAAARQQAEEKKFGEQTDFTSKSLSPVQGPWTNHCVKTFLDLREAGVKPPTDGYSLDPDGIVKSIAVVALLSGKPEMLDAVEKCVKVAQVCTSWALSPGPLYCKQWNLEGGLAPRLCISPKGVLLGPCQWHWPHASRLIPLLVERTSYSDKFSLILQVYLVL